MGVLPMQNDPGARNASSPAGGPQQITKIFPFQSYFDSSFETQSPNPASALLEQDTNLGIIQSTLQDKNQTEAYAVGLAPWSEAPIAIQMQGQDSGGLSSPIVLRPGEIISPSGLARGEQFRNFRGLKWGLPFGWLGGGLVSLFLFKSPDSVPQWQYGAKEVCFHKFQTKIIAANAVPPSPMYTNWPTLFPWAKAYRGVGVSAFNQLGTPNIAVKPTKTLIRLNGALDTAEACRIVFWGSDTFDQTAAGVPPSTQPTITESGYWEFSWPSTTAGGWPAHQPVLTLPDEVSMMAANAYGVTFEALNGGELVGLNVNVARYGLI
jgi:hypothetical protein